ncbi:Hypothetical predicted protein [Olea europaea subsp. europaea]|uniref:Uncharacterized protein n=1 Tax=Olea europaea subsp. europaea TaxID=158383 RepID=A0A8S0P7R7_OLEEU|nr:Hypothetical predicted protein [Olea europaea subsp. europaea]
MEVARGGASTRRGGGAARAGSARVFSGHRVGNKHLRAAIVDRKNDRKTAAEGDSKPLVPHPVTLQFPFEAIALVAAGGGDRVPSVCEVLGANLRPATDSEATGEVGQPAMCIGDWRGGNGGVAGAGCGVGSDELAWTLKRPRLV